MLAFRRFNCAVCDYTSSGLAGLKAENQQDDDIFKTFVALVPHVRKSSKVRTVAMLSLRCLVNHSSNLDNLKLTESAPGEWCLQCLHSSSRELRIAAATTLKAYMRSHACVKAEITRNNRVIALDFLQTLWARNEAPTQESTLLALTQIAQIAGDEELNIILVRFVEYLGHPNLYLSGLVVGEIQKLAQVLGHPVAGLLRPYWRTISAVLVRVWQIRPSVVNQLCDLLCMKVEGLLMLIEEFALPYLILARKQDVIRRMALAHGPTMTPFDLCTQKKNLPAILAVLLAHPSADQEDLMMSLLLEVSTAFADHDLASWVKFGPDLIASELFRAVVDAGDGRDSRCFQALQLLAQLDQRRPGLAAQKKGDTLGVFLETHVLGIVAQMTIMLGHTDSRAPLVEKRRSLVAIGEVVRLGKGRIAVALPQICACLRSALEDIELCNKAFGAWATMVTALPQEDLEPLVDQTLAVIVRGWDMFESGTQQKAVDLVSDLLKSHPSLIRQIFKTMPSLASIPLMAEFESELSDLKRQMDYKDQFLSFTTRLQNENLPVIERALMELADYLPQNQELLHQAILCEQPDPTLIELTRSLLDCAVKFNKEATVTRLCADCLGLIGCLDATRMESVREKKSLVVALNFGKVDEIVDLIIFFLEEVLVGAFLSATDSSSQGFLSWAMQELLKLCEFNESVTFRLRNAACNATYRRWLDLPEVVRNTLTPFLTSRYNVKVGVKHPECSYPIFTPDKMDHAHWLRSLVLDLLQKGTTIGGNVELVFVICCRIINHQDLSISVFLLPFVTLNLVINGIEKHKKQLVHEMLSILEEPLAGSHEAEENIKLCSESVFGILDYMSKWAQLRKKETQVAEARRERGIADHSYDNAIAQIKSVEEVLQAIPPDLISRRAIECKSYARALFNWEEYIRRFGDVREPEQSDALLQHLQEIYTQIDEPDGIEGISAQLHVLNLDQQILEHQKAGRWTAAQSWYEMQLVDKPQDAEVQVNLMTCLRESGQFGKVPYSASE